MLSEIEGRVMAPLGIMNCLVKMNPSPLPILLLDSCWGGAPASRLIGGKFNAEKDRAPLQQDAD